MLAAARWLRREVMQPDRRGSKSNGTGPQRALPLGLPINSLESAGRAVIGARGSRVATRRPAGSSGPAGAAKRRAARSDQARSRLADQSTSEYTVIGFPIDFCGREARWPQCSRAIPADQRNAQSSNSHVLRPKPLKNGLT